MQLLTGKGIVEGSVVWLDIGGHDEVECVALGFVGDAVVLLPRHAPTPAAGARLDAGVPFAELLVETSSHVHAFSCRAQAAEGAGITVHLTDGVHVSQRRSYSRVRLAVATRLLPSGYPEPFYTTTIDVSGGGAQISRDGGIPLASSYEVALAGPLLPAMISAEQCRRVSARRRSACASRRSTHETVSCSSPWCCAR